uniref:Uncharacterized protein n=1 Tax=Rhodosorus marinus TaxID=101924 RepID=A0A7S2ZAI6_9RHOD
MRRTTVKNPNLTSGPRCLAVRSLARVEPYDGCRDFVTLQTFLASLHGYLEFHNVSESERTTVRYASLFLKDQVQIWFHGLPRSADGLPKAVDDLDDFEAWPASVRRGPEVGTGFSSVSILVPFRPPSPSLLAMRQSLVETLQPACLSSNFMSQDLASRVLYILGYGKLKQIPDTQSREYHILSQPVRRLPHQGGKNR